MNLRFSPARLAIALLAAMAPLAQAQDLPATDAPAAAAEAPPMPAMAPAIPYRTLNWYRRDELTAFPPGTVPALAPWCDGTYVAPPLPPLEGDDRGLQSPVYVAAAEMALDEGGESRVAGAVEVRQGQNFMRADRAVITAGRERVLLEGNVYLQDPAMTLEAGRAELALDGSYSHLVDTRYALHAPHIRGSAASIRRADAWRVEIRRGLYTSCEPGNDTWSLAARRIDLDQEAGWGSARDVRLRVQDVPVLYIPYISFPIDARRRSGLLYPTVNVSSSNGTDISVPYYLNLDPQYDLLLQPRWIEERGAMLEGELRYLHGSPAYSVGEGALGLGWLENDDAYGGETRWIGRFRHVGNPRPEWQLLADVTSVSDEDYLDDLSTQLSVNRDSHLDRVLQTSWTGAHWSLLARAQGYQTINPLIPVADRPYRRLPQLLATGDLPTGINGLRGALLAEYTLFDREEGATPNPTGTRVRLEPAVRWQAGNDAARLLATGRLRYAGYLLEDNPQERPYRAIPTLSLEGGAFLERELVVGDRDWVHTLEPRLYALWTPYHDQDGIPLFDTAALTFSYEQLFRDNRYTGGDRVGDARQLSLAMESRLLDDSGVEVLRAGIGQALYLADRRVQLAGAPAETNRLSPLVANGSLRLADRWSTRAEAQFSPEDGEFVRGNLRVNWQDERFRTVNATWRYDDPGVDQAELSGLLPVRDRWNLVARWVYDLDNRRSPEALGGVEYESCCWRARVFGRRTLDIDAGVLESVRSVLFEIELKGLGSLGEKISTELANDIPGYQRRLQSLR